MQTSARSWQWRKWRRARRAARKRTGAKFQSRGCEGEGERAALLMAHAACLHLRRTNGRSVQSQDQADDHHQALWYRIVPLFSVRHARLSPRSGASWPIIMATVMAASQSLLISLDACASFVKLITRQGEPS